MRTSQTGIDLIKRWEGLRTEAYRDSVGVLTIGYGHTKAAGEPKPVAGMTITEEEAEAILRRDLGQYEDAVSKAVTAPITQNQFDAFVSLCFNIGPGLFRKSTAVRRFNAGDAQGAAEALTWFNKAGGKTLRGLVNRRMDERKLFLTDGPLVAHETKSGDTQAGKPSTGDTQNPFAAILAALVALLRMIFGGRK